MEPGARAREWIKQRGADPLDQVNESFDRIRQRQVRGKIVFDTMA